MAKRLIDAEALINWLTRETGFKTNCEDCTDIDCLDCIVEYAIKTAPTIEAKPVVHAHWKEEGSCHQCSNCNGFALSFDNEPYRKGILSNFCPHFRSQNSRQAIWDIEYYGGFSGKEAAIKAIEDACILAVEALKRMEERDLAIYSIIRSRGTECELCKNCHHDFSVCEICDGECEKCKADCKCHICNGFTQFEFDAEAARKMKEKEKCQKK